MRNLMIIISIIIGTTVKGQSSDLFECGFKGNIMRIIEKSEKFPDSWREYNFDSHYKLQEIKYFRDNNFFYAKGKVHEDFGLTPLVILKARHLNAIPDFLYFYVQSENSITREQNMEKLANKVWDMIYHFDYLYFSPSFM